MNATEIISHYNSLNGKKISREELIKFNAQLKQALKIKDPNNFKLYGAKARIEKVISLSKPKEMLKISLSPIVVAKAPKSIRESKRPLPRVERKEPVKNSAETLKIEPVKPLPVDKIVLDKKPLDKKCPKGLSGVVDASAIGKMNFSKIELDGKYKSDFLKMYSDTQTMIWGMPGHGKTVYLLQYAQYLAEKKNKKVLYMAREEMNRSTFTEKINEFKIGHKNLKFTKDLTELKKAGMKVNDFDIIFFDSVQALGFTLEGYKKFVEENPGINYVLVAQSTKDGDFRGGKDWEHEVDIAGEIRNRKLVLRKNRLDNDFAKKSEKLMMDETISKKKADHIIKQKVKDTFKKTKVEETKPVTV